MKIRNVFFYLGYFLATIDIKISNWIVAKTLQFLYLNLKGCPLTAIYAKWDSKNFADWKRFISRCLGQKKQIA